MVEWADSANNGARGLTTGLSNYTEVDQYSDVDFMKISNMFEVQSACCMKQSQLVKSGVLLSETGKLASQPP